MAAAKKTYNKLPLGKVKPEGWLKRQLMLQAEGLSGHIDELFDDLSDKSAWLGGKGEAWERGPYYVDGLIPLAYLLDDNTLKAKAERWVNAILNSADVNGFFGPKSNNDWWPRIVALKALVGYAEATGDDNRILPFFRNFFKYQFNALDEQPLYYWAAARALEELIPLKYYYDKTGDLLAIELAKKLREGAYDWFDIYKNSVYKYPTGQYISRWLVNMGRKIGAKADAKSKTAAAKTKPLTREQIYRRNNMRLVTNITYTHGVNNAMAVKYPQLYMAVEPLTELEGLSKKAITSLLKYHGTAAGIFTSDEHLDGVNPSKGIELCAVVEYMYSLEQLLYATNDNFYADLLELLAFNALPATFTADMCAHQYVQQVNQVSATVAERDFFDVDADGNIFGVAPNYGCCAANLHQGFPKFTESLCLQNDNEFAFLVYAPCTVSAEVGGIAVKLKVVTDYPFKNEVNIYADALSGSPDVVFNFRVPQYTTLKVFVNGKEHASGNKGMLSVKLKLTKDDVVTLKFDAPLTVVTNPDKSVSVRKGSLLLAEKLKTKCRMKGEGRFADREYIPMTQWRTAPEVSRKGIAALEVRENDVPEMPFDENNPALEIDVRARYVYNWDERHCSANPVPKKPKVSQEIFTRTLVPYGATKVRIAQFPHFKV